MIKNYVSEYVVCHMCKNPQTSFIRDNKDRLYYINCILCKSSRTIDPIRSAYHATTKADRKKRDHNKLINFLSSLRI